jgi:hypothetical protein
VDEIGHWRQQQAERTVEVTIDHGARAVEIAPHNSVGQLTVFVQDLRQSPRIASDRREAHAGLAIA